MNKETVLKQYFGYDSFRAGQEYLIDCILADKDVIGVMPTGAGKSICFQVPAVLLKGITLVISPLISLMKDQVNGLSQAGIRAAYINSSLTEKQIGQVLYNAKNNVYKIIYVAPERLGTDSFLEFVNDTEIAMVTVDEAHCVSQWGQDFRPGYRKIADFVDGLKKRPVVSAFTATATAKVREDIAALLRLQGPEVLVTGFDRKNLNFEVQKPADKMEALKAFLAGKKDRGGIVYCATRNKVEEVCDRLKDMGYRASRYHAGLSDEERRCNQDDFLYDRVQIMVATNAFGMGIDKSNVSFVVHYNMPKNIEGYYQEAGRAGRDGQEAECLLLYGGQDVRTHLFLIENSKDVEYPDAETEALLKDLDRKRLKEMTFYCHTDDCLRAYILRYFGERADNYCGHCGNCNSHFETVDITVDAQKILSCVCRAKERFGIKTIVDILRGSKNEKIIRLGLDKLSTYNICSLPEKPLREIINHLVLHEYLYITSDEYPVLKTGRRAHEILHENASVEMKLLKETFRGGHGRDKLQKGSAGQKPVNPALLDRLKALRLSLAKEQNVPAFLIFSDSTLNDMCMKLPKSEDEFLSVSGVGRVKLEHYGPAFMAVISQYAEAWEITETL